jgi:serine/threonine-protein kinase
MRQRKLVQWSIAYVAVAWAVLQGLQLLTDAYGWPPVVLRLAPILMLAGLLVVVVLAWYHGEQGRQRVSAAEGALIASIMIGGAAAAYGVSRTAEAGLPAVASSHNAIAVLPFSNLSASEENAYFASGIHGELLTRLAQLGDLRVISRTSVLAYADTRKSLKQIGEELGVSAVLEGSVQRAGNRVRVEAQLIDVASDTHLWAEQYDRDLADVFAIQSDIAQQIAGALHAKLTRSERAALQRRPTASTDAYEAYLQGLEYLQRPTNTHSDFTTAQQLLERAISIDPNFALAHARLSEVHGRIRRWRYDPSDERLMGQRVEAERAVALQPELPEAHFALGLYHYFGRDDYPAALREFGKALQLAPNNSHFIRFTGFVYRRQDRWVEALELIERAAHLDPRVATSWDDLGATNRMLRRFPHAVRAFTRAQELAPDFYDPAASKGWAFVDWQGEFDTLRAVTAKTTYARSNVSIIELDRFMLELWQRRAGAALAAAEAAPPLIDSFNYYQPRTLLLGWAHRLSGDTVRAVAAFGSALAMTDLALRGAGDDFRMRITRGHALTGLRRNAEAVREAQRIERDARSVADAWAALDYYQAAAEIHAAAGNADAAIRLIGELLDRPSSLTRNNLRLNPFWDPIRDDPRFRSLVSESKNAALSRL